MSNHDDITEIHGKNALLGNLAQQLDGAFTESQINRKKASRLAGEAIDARQALWDEQEAHQKTKKALRESQSLVWEWIHSNEGFKKMAQTFGRELGVTDEQRTECFWKMILEVAKEKPGCENTELLKKAKVNLGIL